MSHLYCVVLRVFVHARHEYPGVWSASRDKIHVILLCSCDAPVHGIVHSTRIRVRRFRVGHGTGIPSKSILPHHPAIPQVNHFPPYCKSEKMTVTATENTTFANRAGRLKESDVESSFIHTFRARLFRLLSIAGNTAKYHDFKQESSSITHQPIRRLFSTAFPRIKEVPIVPSVQKTVYLKLSRITAWLCD